MPERHITDALALNAIVAVMDRQKWDAFTLDAIAALVCATGRTIRQASDGTTEPGATDTPEGTDA